MQSEILELQNALKGYEDEFEERMASYEERMEANVQEVEVALERAQATINKNRELNEM